MSKESVTLGIYVSGRSVEAVSSRGHETVVQTQAAAEPEAWLELVGYGIAIDAKTELRGAFSFAAGTTPEFEVELRRKAREAGYHRVLVVSALEAARRGLTGSVPPQVPLIVLDSERSQVGVGDYTDWVRRIRGREARELAVSLRCLLKPLPTPERRERLQRVVVVASPELRDAFGRREIERELEGIGVRRVDFRHEALALARGVLIAGEQAPRALWRRVART